VKLDQNLQVTQDRMRLSELGKSDWHPILPGGPGHDVAIIMPGFSVAFWMWTYSRCYTTIAAWRAKVILDSEAIHAAMVAITPADGMVMARVRGPCQMPFWSRLAIAQYRKQGFAINEIAVSFKCSPRTVANVLANDSFLTANRSITEYQRTPPAMKRSKVESHNPPSNQAAR
jgi:hypothetical protein